MSIYNKNYKIVNPGTYGHDGKPSLFNTDTSGKRRHFVRYTNKLRFLISLDPVHGRSGYSLDTLGYLKVWGEHMYYLGTKVVPGIYSPLKGFKLANNTWVNYHNAEEVVDALEENYSFTAPYMFDLIYKWENNKKYGEDSKLIYRGNSLESYFKPYLAKIENNTPTDRSLSETLFSNALDVPFKHYKAINNLGNYYGDYGNVLHTNTYNWMIPMPLKLGIGSTEEKWIIRTSEDKKYIRAINYANCNVIMIEGSMTFRSDGKMKISADTKLYEKSSKKLLAMTGHRFGGKEFNIVPGQWFDAAFLFNKYSYDDRGVRQAIVYNYLNYTAKVEMVSYGVSDITIETEKAFMPKEFSVILTDDKGSSTGTININSKDSESGYIPDEKLSTIKELTVQWRKIPGFFYTNQPYDITSEPNYLPWKRIRGYNVPHVHYQNNRGKPLNQENTGFTQKLITDNIHHKLISHNEDYSPIMTLFNVGNNYLSLENLDHYLHDERLLIDATVSEKSVVNGTIVGAASDSRDSVTLGFKEDFTQKEIYDHSLTSGYTTRRRGDQLTRYTTYLFDYLGDEVYTEDTYKEDIMKGIGAQKFSLPNNYNGYRKYIKNTQPGFNDYRPVIPVRGGYIHGFTTKPDKSTIHGNVITYDKVTNRYFFLKQNTEIDVVTLDETRNYYTVKDLSGKTERELKSIHPNLAKRLKRHHYPLRGLIHSSMPKPKSYSGDKLSNLELQVYPWDKSRVCKIAVNDMFTTCVQYINWLPGRFPFVMNKENTRITIRKDHPFRVLNADRDMIINTKKEITVDFPMDLVMMYKDKVNFEFLDKMPTYTETIDNRHLESWRLDTGSARPGDNNFYNIYGLLYQDPIPERTTYGASEIINYKPLKDLGIENKNGLTNISRLWWNNEYPGYYHVFEGYQAFVTKGTKRGWYHYYSTTNKDNSNTRDETYTYLFSEPIPQEETVGDKRLSWSENGFFYNLYHRDNRYRDRGADPNELYVNQKYKDIIFKCGETNGKGGFVNSKLRYKAIAAFGVGDHLNDEIVSTHYWNHNVNITGEYKDIHNADTHRYTRYSSCDRLSNTELKLILDNPPPHGKYDRLDVDNAWLTFEVDGERVYTSKVNKLYYKNEYNTVFVEENGVGKNKPVYVLFSKRWHHFDLDGKTVVFANYNFTGGENNIFIKDSPLFYYKDEAMGPNARFVIPEKYKAIQEKLDSGVPLKVYLHHHPDPDWYKNPTPASLRNVFNGETIFDFTKPPKLIGSTRYIPTRFSYTLDDNKGIIVNIEDALSRIDNYRSSQYVFTVESEDFNTRLDNYEEKYVYSREFEERSKHVKNSNDFFNLAVTVDVFKTKMKNGSGGAYFEDGKVLKLNARSANISEAEYNKLKAKKDPNILKVKITVITRYNNVYVYGYSTTTPYTVTLYFKNYQKLMPNQV